MPALSKVLSSSRSAVVLQLAKMKSGWAARRTSRLGSFTAPRSATVSLRSRSKEVQASWAAAARVSCPPARHHTSAKLPMRAATRFGCSTVTVRPRSSVKVYPWAAEL